MFFFPDQFTSLTWLACAWFPKCRHGRHLEEYVMGKGTRDHIALLYLHNLLHSNLLDYVSFLFFGGL